MTKAAIPHRRLGFTTYRRPEWIALLPNETAIVGQWRVTNTGPAIVYVEPDGSRWYSYPSNGRPTVTIEQL